MTNFKNMKKLINPKSTVENKDIFSLVQNYVNDPLFKDLHLNKDEQIKWSSIIKQIYEEEKTCNNMESDFCHSTNFIHKRIVRNDNNELVLETYFCNKKRLQTNYLIRQFHKVKLLLSLEKKQPDYIAPTNPMELKLEAFLKRSIETEKISGLYLYGKPGIGKSYWIISYSNDLIMKYNKKICYIFLPEIINDIKNNFDKSTQANKNITRLCKECDLLVLDDFGSEYTNSWFYFNFLFVILNYRSENKMPVIFVSNFSLDQLKTFFKQTFSADKKLASNELQEIFITRLFDRIAILANNKQLTYQISSRRRIKDKK